MFTPVLSLDNSDALSHAKRSDWYGHEGCASPENMAILIQSQQGKTEKLRMWQAAADKNCFGSESTATRSSLPPATVRSWQSQTFNSAG